MTALWDLCDEIKTHRQIIEIARRIADPEVNMERMQPLLSQTRSSDQERYWIFFAVRILTMIDVGELRKGLRLGQVPRTWDNGSLREFVKSTFPMDRELPDEIKLEKLFNARNLERVASIQVIWTNNLADHLQLQDDDQSVKLFSHVSFLELHRNWLVQLASDDIETNRIAVIYSHQVLWMRRCGPLHSSYRRERKSQSRGFEESKGDA
jgi:hypothetical protein